MIQLMSGAIVTGYLVTGLFFLRYWRQSGDRLFAIFAAAFWLLAVQRLALALTTQYFEDVTWLYGVRLVAFVLILLAIIDKNRSAA
jgi:hypothetical protein